MSSTIRLVTIVLALLTLMSCRAAPSASHANMAPVDPSAHNVALVVGAQNDLPGVDTDIQGVSQLLKDPKFGYKVIVLSHASVNDIMSNAQTIGASLGPTSTMFFYFSGHGSADGSLYAEGIKPFQLSAVVASVSQGLGQGRFQRLIAVMDSCFSGQNVNGQDAMFLNGDDSSSQSALSDQAAVERSVDGASAGIATSTAAAGVLPFNEALILGAAQKNQTSADMGAGVGGAFTAAWRQAITSDLPNGSTITIAQMLDQTKQLTLQYSEGSHSPVWKSMPASLLDEPIAGAPAAPVPLSNDIFMALLDSANGSLAVVSIPTNAAASTGGASLLEVCRGDKATCIAGSGTKIGNLVPAPDLVLPNRSLYRSDAPVVFQPNDTVTIMIRNADGSVLDSRAMHLSAKS